MPETTSFHLTCPLYQIVIHKENYLLSKISILSRAGSFDLLTVYLGKLDFLSVSDFSLSNLPRENFIVWGLDMSREQ